MAESPLRSYVHQDPGNESKSFREKVLFGWLGALTATAALILGILVPEILSLRSEVEVLARTALTTGNVVTEVEQALGAVSSFPTVDLAPGTTIGGAEIFPASVVGPQGPQGVKGDKGDKGDQGLTGAPGLNGLLSLRYEEELGQVSGAAGVVVNHNLGAPAQLVHLIGTCISATCGTYSQGQRLLLRDSKTCINSCSGYGIEVVDNSTVILQISQDGPNGSQNRFASGSPGGIETLRTIDWSISVVIYA